MGALWSFSTGTAVSTLPQPFWKMKELKQIRGPNEQNKFVIDDTELGFGADNNPIKFRYNSENDDDWCWEWTCHRDQHEWYPVKTKYYTIAKEDINKYPYNLIVDKDKIIPLELHFVKKTEIVNNTEEMKDDHKEEEEEEEEEIEYYSTQNNDNVYSKTSYVQCKLPDVYENIREHLAVKDPIPPHMLHKYNLATNAYQQALISPLANSKQLKCRFASKILNPNGFGSTIRRHPVLLFYEIEPINDWDTVWMFHLMQDSSILKVAVEFDFKHWKKFVKHKGWTVSEESFNLSISGKSLLDVAKWGIEYEKKNPDYSELHHNCRKFMLELSDYLNITWKGAIMSEKIWYTMMDSTEKVSGISQSKSHQND